LLKAALLRQTDESLLRYVNIPVKPAVGDSILDIGNMYKVQEIIILTSEHSEWNDIRLIVQEVG
jgi:hypothetical protein